MPRNGSGTYTLPAGNPVVSGTIIESTWANSTLADLGDSITNSLARNGEGGMTAPLRLTDGVVATPSLAFANETGSGLYRAAAGDVGLAVLGNRILRLQAAGASVAGTFGVSGNTTLANLEYTGTLTGGTGIVNIGTGQIYKDASGNVGFGSASPVGRVDVVANAYGVFVARSASAGTNVDVIGLKAVDSAAANFANVAYQAKSHVWGYNGSTLGMVLDASGNLGVGTSSPSTPIDVVSNSSAVALKIRARSINDFGFIQFTANNGTTDWASIYAQNQILTFGTGGAERMRIDSSGNLLVGTTSPAPFSQSTIVGPSTGSTVALAVIHNGTSGGNVRGFLTKAPNFSGNDGILYIAARSTGDVAYQYTNGNWVNINNSYGVLSDAKLKENIVDATSKLDDVLALRVRNYNLIKQPGEKQIGFVAQEFEQVFPGLVEETTDYDEFGKLDSKTKSIKSSVLVPILVKAIQEQQALITQLQADVAALKAIPAA